MIIETLRTTFKEDLLKLKTEIELYRNEKKIWVIEKSIANSGVNLCLHLVGNLNTYIGAGLSRSGYIRHRDLEFSLKDVPKAELIQKINDTIPIVEKGIGQLTTENLNDDFPMVIWDKPTGMVYTLVKLLSHLNYHLGQINYHRRLLDY